MLIITSATFKVFNPLSDKNSIIKLSEQCLKQSLQSLSDQYSCKFENE